MPAFGSVCTCFLCQTVCLCPVQNFDDIRPYQDSEVPGVVARLLQNSELRDGIAYFLFPRLYATSPAVARYCTGLLLRWRGRGLRRVHDIQMLMKRYIDHMVRDSVVSLTTSGLDRLPGRGPFLFISNHRDIVLDTVFLNRVLHAADHATCRMAVGDNLLSTDYAADIMRLNKSFVVERSASGAKAVLRALQKTSAYVKHSLEQGESVWIAQRSGRAKDGFDRTEPALLKMLTLAYRDESKTLDYWLSQVTLIPVSISYELDPCDLAKAEELRAVEEVGEFTKSQSADLEAIVASVTGKKGRVHIAFGDRVVPPLESAELVAQELDRSIVGGFKIYPTQASAYAEVTGNTVPSAVEAADDTSQRLFEQRVAACSPELRPHLLAQYANLVLNQEALGLHQS